MGFFKKKKHSIIENTSVPVSDTPAEPISLDEDDFDMPPKFSEVSRDEFHQMAEDTLQEALEDGIAVEATEGTETAECTEVTDKAEEIEASATDTADEEQTEIIDAEPAQEADTKNSEDEISAETDDGDDFDVSDETEAVKVTDIEMDLPDPEPEEEKRPKMTYAEFFAKHKKGMLTSYIASGVVLVLCLILYIYGCATVPKGVMGRNIYIENINISNLTYEDALEKVKSTALLDNCNITVVCKGHTYTINGIDVGLTARVEDTVDKAMRYGKTGNIFIDGFANALQVLFKHRVMPSANVNKTILRNRLDEFGNQVYGELIEHQLEVGDEKIICTPGRTGFSGNTDKALEQVIKAIEKEDFKNIRVALKSASPKDLTIEALDAFTYTDPQDARFEIADNTVTVVPEVWGRYLNLEEAKPYLSKIYEGGPTVNIPFYTSEPAIKAELLNEKLFNTTLGSYYSSYGGSTANRAANVNNAAAKINEKVLAPGEVFSFNDTVGKRSVANGFFEAQEYSNGETVMGIGGGTCQVSSTLYNAVLYADLSIVSRLNHMFTVGYCPAGQDATVSDSGVDFKFMNNTDYPIKISAITGGGRVTVSIIGTQRDIPHTVKIENHSTYSNGNQTVRSYRLVYDPQGALIRKDDLGKSFYMAHPPKATAAPAVPPTPSTPAAATTAPVAVATAAPSVPSAPAQPVVPVE